MPHDEPDETDPMELMGHAVPSDAAAVDEMATVIIDEYARMGFSRDEILHMFREPFFRMTHAVWRERGHAWCVALVDHVLSHWRVPPRPEVSNDAQG